MKIFMQISWRNIWRNKRRSLVIISTVAIGIFAMMTCVGFINGFNVQLVDNTINTSLGHIAIHKAGFQNDMKLEYNFRADGALNNVIGKNPSVVSFAPRVKVAGMILSSEASRGVTVMGIDPKSERRVSRICQYILRDGGSRFLDDPSEDAILISKSLAKKLDLVLGDKLVLMIQAQNGQIIGAGLRIKGFFVTPIDGIDKHVVYVGIYKLQEIAGIGGNISEINIITKDKNIADGVKRSLAQSIGNDGLEILSWKDMAPNIVRMIDLADNVVLFFIAVIFITVIFSIINTMVMAIMERFHEIGVMKSIGTRPSSIFAMIVLEAMNCSAVGLFAGILAGGLLIALLSYTGLDLSAYSGNLRRWGTGSVIYPSLRIADMISAAAIVGATTLAASLYPAVLAARIKPLEALHFT
jgi:ABC-type lipoprotein release transport system permease subunit